jgi:hypothetical protein
MPLRQALRSWYRHGIATRLMVTAIAITGGLYARKRHLLEQQIKKDAWVEREQKRRAAEALAIVEFERLQHEAKQHE